MTKKEAITLFIMVAVTFLGMVGLYVGFYYAYQNYQDTSTQLESSTLGKLLKLFK